MKKQFLIAVSFTLITTVIIGLIYPLVVTGLSQLLFPKQANGSLIIRAGQVVGSRLLGQNFTGEKYFHPRPSNAGTGYDPTASGGSNLGPTNQALVTRVEQDVAKYQQQNPGATIPSDLVTSSGSGLDPDISPASAEFQIASVAKARGVTPDEVRRIVAKHTQGRQWGIFGEARVNVLELNLDLDENFPAKQTNNVSRSTRATHLLP
jgi:potassium-transporting ATPase KdpC subunit